MRKLLVTEVLTQKVKGFKKDCYKGEEVWWFLGGYGKQTFAKF
jgi:hypothetical protein